MNHISINAIATLEPVSVKTIDPALVAASVSPSSISAQTALAEDTIIGTAMDIKPGKATSAMFANPLNGGMEEMLYIDESQALRWIRHSNGENNSPGAQVEPSWVNDTVATGYTSVVAAVHPTGSVWAFAILASDSRVIDGFRLTADAASPAGAVWVKTLSQGVTAASATAYVCDNLSVQYLNDRPATPLVLFTASDGVNGYVNTLQATIPTATDTHCWLQQQAVSVGMQNVLSFGCMGKDTPAGSYFIYTLGNSQVTCVIANTNGVKRITCQGTQYTKIIGTCSTRNGPSCLAFAKSETGDMQLAFIYPTTLPAGPTCWTSTIAIDQALDDAVVWQDSSTHMHLYGRGQDGGLYVIHQLDWLRARGSFTEQNSTYTPVWDSHGRAASGPDFATTRALIADVASYRLDAYPDDAPDQHVMHSGVAPGEMCAFYKQIVGTSYWAKEKVRIVSNPLPKPYLVKRYQTVITVKRGCDAPAVGVDIMLTADAPTDLQANGQFYRPGPNTPIRLTTNASGKVTLRIMAEGLHQPNLHVSCVGITESLSIDPAAAVQKYLGGRGGLPNHPEGFTENAVLTAKNPDGSFVFPRIKRDTMQPADDWLPTAADLVSWCKSAFAAEADGKLLARDGRSKVLAISFQVHDRARTAYQEHTTPAQVMAHFDALDSFQQVDGLFSWAGDFFQGIRAGLTKVKEIAINLETRAVSMLVELKDGVVQVANFVWGKIVGAAHAIEAAFVALEAKVMDVIHFLSWLLNLKDVWDTKMAFETALDLLMPIVKKSLSYSKGQVDGWFDTLEKNVDGFFELLKSKFNGQTIGTQQANPLLSSAHTPMLQKFQDASKTAHTSWFMDLSNQAQVASVAGIGDIPVRGMRSGDDNPFEKLFDDLLNSPAWKQLGPIWNDTVSLLTNLLTVTDDPKSIFATEMTTLIDIFERFIRGFLQLGDTLLDMVLDFAISMLDESIEALDQPLDMIPLLPTIFDFIQEMTGVAPGAREKLTVRHLGLLFAAYPFTLIFKAATDTAPFPGGTFPDFLTGNSHTSLNLQDDEPGPVVSKFTWSMISLHYFLGTMVLAEIINDEQSNKASVDGRAVNSPNGVAAAAAWWPLMWAGAHLIRLVCTTPATFGMKWPWDPNPAPREGVTFIAWMCEVIKVVLDFSSAILYRSTFKNVAVVSDGPSVLLTMFGILQCSIAAGIYGTFPGVGQTTAGTRLAANISANLPDITSYVRYFVMHNENKELTTVVAIGKAIVDLTFGVVGGALFLATPSFELAHQPTINLDRSFADGKLLEIYISDGCTANEGTLPYTWATAHPTALPDGCYGGLPPGITMDPETGDLKGIPEKTGRFAFKIVVMDSYAPPLGYQSGIFTLEILKS